MEESDCKYISSRGILKSCFIHSQQPISDITSLIQYDFSKLREGCSIYITTSCIPQLEKMIHNIPMKFILVSGDSDRICPIEIFHSEKQFLEFIENDKIIHWYAQNCIIQHSKITKLPIGLDYHTIYSNKNHWWGDTKTPIQQENELDLIRKDLKPFWEREIRCYSNFHFALHNKYGNPRKRALETIPNECIYYEEKSLSRIESWENQSKYGFVVSPHGNGLDCHRTWEALLLGCIVIVEKSNIDDLYIDLPVFVIDNYKNISTELLQKIVEEYKNRVFNYEKLFLSYWLKIIHPST